MPSEPTLRAACISVQFLVDQPEQFPDRVVPLPEIRVVLEAARALEGLERLALEADVLVMEDDRGWSLSFHPDSLHPTLPAAITAALAALEDETCDSE